MILMNMDVLMLLCLLEMEKKKKDSQWVCLCPSMRTLCVSFWPGIIFSSGLSPFLSLSLTPLLLC